MLMPTDTARYTHSGGYHPQEDTLQGPKLTSKWMSAQPVSLSGFKSWLGKNYLGDCYQLSNQQIFFLITTSKVPGLYLQMKYNIFLMFNLIFKMPLL